jgi:hypothetical protein
MYHHSKLSDFYIVHDTLVWKKYNGGGWYCSLNKHNIIRYSEIDSLERGGDASDIIVQYQFITPPFLIKEDQNLVWNVTRKY